MLRLGEEQDLGVRGAAEHGGRAVETTPSAVSTRTLNEVGMRAVTGEAARTMMEPSGAMVRITDEFTATTFSLSTQNTRQKIIKKNTDREI